MKYYEITIETTSEASELVAEILTDAGSNGISIFDPNDLLELSDSGVIWDYMDEHLIQNDGKAQVKGYFAPSDLESSLEYIKNSFETLKQNCPFEYGSLSMSQSVVDDEDWVENWKQYYRPIEAGRVTNLWAASF